MGLPETLMKIVVRMNRFRRLLVRWEKREDTYLAMIHFALGIITWFYCLPR